MNASIWVAIVTALAGLLTAAFTYAVTKRREREADSPTLKLEMYREFTSAMAGMAEGDATDETKKCPACFGEIRHDLGEVPTEDPSDFQMKLYTSGVECK